MVVSTFLRPRHTTRATSHHAGNALHPDRRIPGAGKTTTIAALAHSFQQQGLKVGIVTNDQATDLVDTHSLRSQGHLVGEVAGACFCCNFNELLSTVEGLREAALPDVVLAEPVGSCTDIVATVIQPLAQLHQGRFDIAPYAVIVKPSHGLRILAAASGRASHPRRRTSFASNWKKPISC